MSNRSIRAGRALVQHRFLFRLASISCNAFLFVLVFQYFALSTQVGGALSRAFFFYALMQATTMLATPFAMRHMRGGMLRGMIYGTLALLVAAAWLSMLFSGTFAYGSVYIALALGISTALYRAPYAVEKATVRVRSPEVGELALMIMPLLLGCALMFAVPPYALMLGAALLAAVSLVPLYAVPNVYEHFSWGYRETFGKFGSPEHHKLVLSSVRRGVASAFLFALVPLFVLFATRSYAWVGGSLSFILLLTLLFNEARLFAHVEWRADDSSYIDEYTALKEMGLALGRLLVALVCAIAIGLII